MWVCKLTTLTSIDLILPFNEFLALIFIIYFPIILLFNPTFIKFNLSKPFSNCENKTNEIKPQ